MSEGKAFLVTVLIAGLFGGLMYCFWELNGTVYRWIMTILALYGFVIGGCHLNCWLKNTPRFPSNDAQKQSNAYADEFYNETWHGEI